MSDTRQHHEATLTPKPESVEATRELLLQCARQVEARQGESWPTTWCASYDEGRKVFVVEALFPDAAAVAFHQANIGPILNAFGALRRRP
jgi:hypothetical protein